jgi:hypothetical protein
LAIIWGAQRGFKINSINPNVYNEREILLLTRPLSEWCGGGAKEEKKESQEEKVKIWKMFL